MASLTVNMPDFLDELAMSEDDIKEVIEAAKPEAEAAVKKSLSQSIRNPGNSELVKSVKPYKTKKKRRGEGYACFVGPSGTSQMKPDGSRRKASVRNMEIAMYLNYGTKHEAARPWLDKAANSAEVACAKKMQEEYEKRIRK